jgi:hypothetical protein
VVPVNSVSKVQSQVVPFETSTGFPPHDEPPAGVVVVVVDGVVVVVDVVVVEVVVVVVVGGAVVVVVVVVVVAVGKMNPNNPPRFKGSVLDTSVKAGLSVAGRVGMSTAPTRAAVVATRVSHPAQGVSRRGGRVARGIRCAGGPLRRDDIYSRSPFGAIVWPRLPCSARIYSQ